MSERRGRIVRYVGVGAGISLAACVVAALMTPPVDVECFETDLAEMVRVEGGRYLIADLQRSEFVDAYWIDRFEVTGAEWAWYVKMANGPLLRVYGDEPQGPDYPIRHLTHDEAEGFARWHMKELPSNAQWERAAQGPGGGERPWGVGFFPEAANVHESWVGRQIGERTVSRVGSFESGKSAVGAYDMVGNVWEWTRSPWRETFKFIDGSIDGYVENLQVATALGERFMVLRGGSFRTLMRGGGRLERLEFAGARSSEIGFRCVISHTEVERQRRLAPAIRALGYRDPIRRLFMTLPAASVIRRESEAAIPYLRRARASVHHAGTLHRIDELIASIDRAQP